MSLLKKLWTDESGNFSILGVFVLVPLLMAVGVAVDLSRLSKMDLQLQDAADSAALAGAISYMEKHERRMVIDAKATLYNNRVVDKNVRLQSVTVVKTSENTVRVEAKARVKPMFVSMFGYPRMDLSVSSVATLGEGIGAEVALAIDTTSSMAFGTSWNATMGTIGNILDDMKDFTGRDNFYVTLVPFQDRVSLGTGSRSWVDAPSGYDWSRWEGCVEPREEVMGAYNWAVSDAPGRTNKFAPTSIGDVMSRGLPVACPGVPITGPTNNVSEVITASQNLSPNGTGRFDVGLAWAWRSLSPRWRGQWGVSQYPSKLQRNNLRRKSDKLRRKYIIFMTDGRSEAYTQEAMMERSWNHNEGSAQAFAHIAKLCADIKAEDIEIYMLQIPGNDYATSTLEGCASSPAHYKVIHKAEDMTFAFHSIKDTLYANIRIDK